MQIVGFPMGRLKLYTCINYLLSLDKKVVKLQVLSVLQCEVLAYFRWLMYMHLVSGEQLVSFNLAISE